MGRWRPARWCACFTKPFKLVLKPGKRHSSRKVAYYFPRTVGDYHFGEHHPMKPHRLTLTNHLVIGYGLHNKMDIFSPRVATQQELTSFHDDDYIDFLARITPDNMNQDKFVDGLKRFNMNDDCPVFDNMFEYFKQYSGASLAAARRMNSGDAEVVVNWSGGLHHAKKSKADGFCYINDIVLAILELLRIHNRVLYIDIDIHHGDGVQEAFYDSNRVLTVSFHKYAEGFFPGTGKEDENGHQVGKYFSLNVPLSDGIDDYSYVSLFKAVMEPTISSFRPDAIVLQCGADSLGCDRLGAFNLSIKAHGECVRFIKAFNIPLMILGGGGYTIKNVSRCWAYETAVLVDQQQEISDVLPDTPFHDFFYPDYRLHPPITGRSENHNSRASLEKLRADTLERLRYMHGAPSVQMQEIPPSLASWLQEDEDQRAPNRKEKAEPEIAMPPPLTPASANPPALARSQGRKRSNSTSAKPAELPKVPSRGAGRGQRGRGGKAVRGRGKVKGSTAAAPSAPATPDVEATITEEPAAEVTPAAAETPAQEQEAKMDVDEAA